MKYEQFISNFEDKFNKKIKIKTDETQKEINSMTR